MLDGDLTIFTETEIYPTTDGIDYFGLYMADYKIRNVSLGLQAEQFNLSLTAGPHISLTLNEHLAVDRFYHSDFRDDHTFRVTIKMKFE